MYVPLVPCPGCDRHLRHVEDACPFCGTDVAGQLSMRIAPDTNRRLSRAAAFVFASTIAAGACGGSTIVEDEGAGGNTSTSNASNASSGSLASTTATAGQGGAGGEPSGAGGVVAAYGAPAVGGAGGDPAGSGGFKADYGAPPPP